KGGAADFTRGVPVMIMLTLSVSYLLAISAVPLLAARFLKPRKNIHKDRSMGLARSLGGLVYRYPGRLIVACPLLLGVSVGWRPFLAGRLFHNPPRPRALVVGYLPECTERAQTRGAAR